MKSEDLQAILTIVFSIPVIAGGGWLGWKHIGGWRGVRSPRIMIPLLVAISGLVLTIVVSALMRERQPGVEWVPNPAWMGTAIWVGLGLFMVGFATALYWTAFRFIRLVRVIRRLDDYVEGAVPLPVPDNDPVVRRDLATAARLLADPALSHRHDPIVIERVRALVDGRPLPAAVPARD